MVTKVNFEADPNWGKLFTKAWKILDEKGRLHDEDSKKTQFADIGHYLSYLEELIDLDATYLMLPVDEASFTIDANTREITAPPEFLKCSGVVSDTYAEIITFTIDRYFDYKDLDLVQIAVQWENAAAKTQGISIIKLKDTETLGEEDKIRFGWPLTAEMTSAAGTLKFAVRFFTKQEGTNEYVYLLNTLPVSVPIKDTLKVTGVEENNSDLTHFKSFVRNSQNPSYAKPTPVVFLDHDLPSTAKIQISEDEDIDDTLTLKAGAYTADNNSISYYWTHEYEVYTEYNPEGEWPTDYVSGIYTKTADGFYEEISSDLWPEAKEDGVVYYTKSIKVDDITETSNTDYIVNKMAFEKYDPDEWPAAHNRPADTLWATTDASNIESYYPYMGEWPESKDEIDLYFGYTTLYFTKGGSSNIIGTYQVKGVNEKWYNKQLDGGGTEKVKVNWSEDFSTRCKIAPPAPITAVKDIAAQSFFKADASTIKLQLVKDTNNPTRTYSVLKDGTTMITDAEVPSTNIIEYKAPVAGSYSINVSSELNRVTRTRENVGGTVRFYDNAVVPVGTPSVKEETQSTFTRVDNSAFALAPYNGIWDDTTNIAEFGKGIADQGTEYFLKVERLNEAKNEIDGINIGEITFKWSMQELNKPEVELPAPGNTGYIGINAEETDNKTYSIINVRVQNPDTPVSFKCQIENKISVTNPSGITISDTKESEIYVFTIGGKVDTEIKE